MHKPNQNIFHPQNIINCIIKKRHTSQQINLYQNMDFKMKMYKEK